MRGPIDVTRDLLAADVPHEIVHLRRRIDDAAELPGVLGLPSRACLAVRLYDDDTRLLAALVTAGRTAATTALARAAGTRVVRPTHPDKVSAVTDSHPSLVAPVGLPAGVLVLADAGLREQEVVYAPTGDGSTALKIRAADLLALTGATVAPLVEPGADADPAWQAAEGAGRVESRVARH